jgi:hypothetical protein
VSKDVDVTSLGITAGPVAALDPAHVIPAMLAICGLARDKADALLLLDACGLLAATS